jgi:hypothetical protein
MVWSLLLADRGRYVLSGALFAALLNMKHLFAYMAPAYFFFLLRHHVLEGPGGGGAAGAARRLFTLGGAVAAVFAASLGPFVAMGQLGQVGAAPAARARAAARGARTLRACITPQASGPAARRPPPLCRQQLATTQGLAPPRAPPRRPAAAVAPVPLWPRPLPRLLGAQRLGPLLIR